MSLESWSVKLSAELAIPHLSKFWELLNFRIAVYYNKKSVTT